MKSERPICCSKSQPFSFISDLFKLYEAWNKPEKTEKWRIKLLQTEAMDERQNTFKVTFLGAKKTSEAW